MTSLTPNEDRVRAVCTPSGDTLAAATEPGMRGVHARMNIAIMTALMTAMAQEVDRGSDAVEIISAGAIVTGQMVASLGASLNSDDPIEGATEILSAAARSAGSAAAAIAAGEHDRTMFEATEVARA